MGRREELIESLSRHGKGMWERFLPWLSNVASIASIIGLLITIIFGVKWEWQFIIVVMSLIVAQMSLIWVIVNTIRQRDREHAVAQTVVDEFVQLENKISSLEAKLTDEFKNKEFIAYIIHNFCHQYRKVITEVFSYKTTQGESPDHYRTLREFFGYMLSQIKEIYDVMTNDTCAACVKIVGKGNNISTLIRDNISNRKRSLIDIGPKYREFDYRLNSAFEVILDDTNPARYYRSDDLSKEKNYKNSNPDWKSLYNATLVVPIRYVYDETVGATRVLGFICVDNFKGGFTSPLALDVLASFADLSFHLWHLIDEKVENSKGSVIPK